MTVLYQSFVFDCFVKCLCFVNPEKNQDFIISSDNRRISGVSSVLVFDAIFEEIDRVIQDGVTQKELDIAIQQIQAELILGYESSYNRMNGLGKSLLIRDTAIPLEEELERIAQVTSEDVRLFFEKYLKKDQCSMAIVGNDL